MLQFLAGLLTGLAAAALAGLLWARHAMRKLPDSYRHLQDSDQRAREAERLAEIGTLTGGLAHEIKNPLSTMKINLQLLAEEPHDPHDDRQRRGRRKIETLREQVTRLEDILADFLQYAGRHELHPADHDVNRVVSEIVDFFEPQASQSRIRILPAYADAPLVCRLDVDLVKQALLNLFLNAQQAMPDGGELLVRLRPEGPHAVVDVIDTGGGIPPAEAEKIFQAYWSTKPGGSGLGLPLVRRIVREHDGEITFTSEPGKGTQFTIRLPITEPAESPEPP